MPQHRADTVEGPQIPGNPDAPSTGLTRREAMAGGSLAIGALLLTGCSGSPKPSGAALPPIRWNADNSPHIAAAPLSFQSYHATVPMDGGPSSIPAPAGPDVVPPSGIVPRSQWARLGVARQDDIYSMNGIRRITVHHDGMPPTSLGSFRQVASRIEQIRQSHVVGRGWADLGYHYVIDPYGRIWEGRSIRYQGAHVKDQNENNLGILVMGNFEMQSPTTAALTSLDRFLFSQMQQYRISLTNVRTHKERAPTACPGRNLQAYMIQTRSGGGTLNTLAARVGLNRG